MCQQKIDWVADEFLATPIFSEFQGLSAGCLKGRAGGGQKSQRSFELTELSDS